MSRVLSYIHPMNTRVSTLLLGLLMLSLMFADVGRSEPRLRNPTAAEADDPTNPGPPPRVQVSSAEMGKLLVKRVPPEYPEHARSKGIQGTVMLRATVSKEGNVIDVSVISGDPELSKAALKAAKKWKYHPYLVAGQALEVVTTIQMNFQLSAN
jgi:TonB family protein